MEPVNGIDQHSPQHIPGHVRVLLDMTWQKGSSNFLQFKTFIEDPQQGCELQIQHEKYRKSPCPPELVD